MIGTIIVVGFVFKTALRMELEGKDGAGEFELETKSKEGGDGKREPDDEDE